MCLLIIVLACFGLSWQLPRDQCLFMFSFTIEYTELLGFASKNHYYGYSMVLVHVLFCHSGGIIPVGYRSKPLGYWPWECLSIASTKLFGFFRCMGVWPKTSTCSWLLLVVSTLAAVNILSSLSRSLGGCKNDPPHSKVFGPWPSLSVWSQNPGNLISYWTSNQ